MVHVDIRNDTSFFGALRLLELLHEARRSAQTPALPRLAALAGMLEETADGVLEAMEKAGWVRRVEPAGWVLARDLDTLPLAEVFRVFALDPGVAGPADGALAEKAAERVRGLLKDLELPVERLLEAPAGPPAEHTGGAADKS
jgi:membrane protein